LSAAETVDETENTEGEGENREDDKKRNSVQNGVVVGVT